MYFQNRTVTPLLTLTFACAMAWTLSARAQDESARIAELEKKVDALTQDIQRAQYGDVFAKPEQSQYGMGAAAAKVYQIDRGMSIGGYGEALYENFDGDKTSQADFLRAVLYLGHKFDDHWVLNTETEFEHATTDEEGSVSVEFAYLDYLWETALNLRVGLVLIPMGLVNELHEPNAFLSARRPDVESRIIPSTWRENGIGLFGDLGQFSYKAYVVNGLDAEDFSAAGLRGGRQKGSKAQAEDLAIVGRLDWEPTPGVLIGGSLYHGDSGQDLDIDVTTDVMEGHLDLRRGPLQVRGLVTVAEVDDVAALNRLSAVPGEDGEIPGDSDIDSAGSSMLGWYLEAGLNVADWLMRDSQMSLTPFVRYEQIDTQEDVPTGFRTSSQNDLEIITTGLNFKPIDQIVFKADYQFYDDAENATANQFNLSAGYVF